MSQIIYITGGQRSGKSRFAQALAEQLSPQPLYLATAHCWDAEFAERIQRHQRERGAHWSLIEEELELSRHALQGRVVLLDCVTLWLTKIYSPCSSSSARKASSGRRRSGRASVSKTAPSSS